MGDDIQRCIDELAANRKNTRFERLQSVCERFFGEPRRTGGSHVIFKTPWPGEPRINLQRVQGGKAKPYQVDQVLRALEKLKVTQTRQKDE